uniref:SJCHGC08768 protein n=1 Tax=Schistosoma japonicum TaxID=6182 RepID=Q5DDJ1_SCHJA|nr:SJCHGC08768 protein [Schistosoma japonicum]
MSAFLNVDSVGNVSDLSIAITSSSASAEGSDCCSSPCRSRKRYECVPESMKTTQNYIIQRIRNRSAVRKFREKLKTTAKRQEDVKANLISLTKLYDNELVRIKHSKQQLELLLYRHAAHKNIVSQLNEILSAEAQARLNFQTHLRVFRLCLIHL